MPQLDIVSFASELFWFFICYCILYLFITIFFLPNIAYLFLEKNIVIRSLRVLQCLGDKRFSGLDLNFGDVINRFNYKNQLIGINFDEIVDLTEYLNNFDCLNSFELNDICKFEN